jgi:hypothetical protein
MRVPGGPGGPAVSGGCVLFTPSATRMLEQDWRSSSGRGGSMYLRAKQPTCTVKKGLRFSRVPSRDVTNQTLSGRE